MTGQGQDARQEAVEGRRPASLPRRRRRLMLTPADAAGLVNFTFGKGHRVGWETQTPRNVFLGCLKGDMWLFTWTGQESNDKCVFIANIYANLHASAILLRTWSIYKEFLSCLSSRLLRKQLVNFASSFIAGSTSLKTLTLKTQIIPFIAGVGSAPHKQHDNNLFISAVLINF